MQSPQDRRPESWAHAEVLASSVGLDMSIYWEATAASYLGRVSKAQIGEAVQEAVSAEAAARIADLKKAEMAEVAETLLAGTGWLPAILRTHATPAGPEASRVDAIGEVVAAA